MAKIKITETMLKKMIAESLRYHLSGRIDEAKHNYKGETRKAISKWFEGFGKDVSPDSGRVAKIESDFRDTFMHGYSNIIDPVKRLEPIFAKIALDYGWWSHSPNNEVISGLQNIMEYIIDQSNLHKSKNTGEPFLLNGNYPLNKITSETTYEQLKELCSGAFNDDEEVSGNSELKIEDIDYSNSKGYEVKKNVSFKEANKIGEKSGFNGDGRLCYTDNESYWSRYTNNGKNTAYVLLKDGYEDMDAKDYSDHEKRPYDPYGLSMIFLFVDPNGNLKYSNVRWNHKFQELGGDKTDDNFTKREIEKLTGLSFDDHFINVGDNSISYLKKIEDRIAGKDMDGEQVSWYETQLNFKENYYLITSNSGHANVLDKNTNKLLFSKWFDRISERTVIGSKVFWHVKLGERRNVLTSGGFLLFDGPIREWPEYISGFTNGIVTFKVNGKTNFMDHNGNILYEPNNPDKWFDYARLNPGYWSWFVMKNGNYYFFTIDGQLMSIEDGVKYLTEQDYDLKKFFTFFYDEGYYYKIQIVTKCNVMRKDGTLISDTWFEYIGEFNNGLAIVELEDKYSFMDFNGKIIYEPNNPEKWFDNCTVFHNGYGTVLLKGKENFIDKNGNILSPNLWFDQCLAFHNDGFGSVCLNGTWYSIDKDGNLYTASKKPVSISNGEISIKESKNMDIKRLKNIIQEEISSYLLTEATEESLHQQYDKIFGKQLIDDLMWYDTTPNKKFALWVIRVCINQNNKEPQKILIKYLHDSGPLTDLATAVENGFQPYSFSDIDTALDNYERKQINPAVYKDDTIHIYNPRTYVELKALIKAVAKQPLDSFHWCVSSSGAITFWPRYTKNDEYKIFFIHNIKQNKFYLWNNNPSEDTRKQFNNQYNEPVKPIDTAGLTDGAVQFLDSTTELDFVEDVDNIINEETGEVLYEGILGGLYNLYDPTPDDMYHHNLQIWSCENEGEFYDFGYSAYDVLLNSPNLFIMTDRRFEDCAVAYVDENKEIIFGNDDLAWGIEYDGIYFVTNIPDKLVVYNQNNGNIFSLDISSPLYIGSVGCLSVVQNDDYDVYYVFDHNNGEIVFKSSDILEYCVYKEDKIELYVDEDFDIDDYENILPKELPDGYAPYVSVEHNGELFFNCSPDR